MGNAGARSRADGAPCPLSVIVSTHQPWPTSRLCLDALHPQARVVGAEIILADSSGRALPPDAGGRYPLVRHVEVPGASSHELRARAIELSRGEIIAITEDHCIARPSWCQGILSAHRNNPAAAAVGGAVENASSRRLIDWASFLIANGPFMKPLDNGPSDRIALQANASYKRATLAPHLPFRTGFMEMLFNQKLRDSGAELIADDHIVVDHHQSLTFLTTCTLHFHNGRCIAGLRLENISAVERTLRLVTCWLLPPVMFWRTLRSVIAKRRSVDQALMGAPLIACLLICHAAGEMIGYARGPGRSGSYLHIG